MAMQDVTVRNSKQVRPQEKFRAGTGVAKEGGVTAPKGRSFFPPGSTSLNPASLKKAADRGCCVWKKQVNMNIWLMKAMVSRSSCAGNPGYQMCFKNKW